MFDCVSSAKGSNKSDQYVRSELVAHIKHQTERLRTLKCQSYLGNTKIHVAVLISSESIIAIAKEWKKSTDSVESQFTWDNKNIGCRLKLGDRLSISVKGEVICYT